MFGLIWWLISVFMTVRFYQMAKIACRLLRLHVIYPKLGWTFNLDPYKNSWAVVTGGTDGIGKAYLNEIAAKGFTKFALIGRNKKKLDGIQRFLTTKYKAEVQVLVFDFASTEYGPLEDFIKGLGEIGALFNFVGTMPSSSGKFCDSLPGVASKVFAVNAVSAVKLVDLVLPGMAQRDEGLVVHCSSIAGHRPMHRCSSYSASKAALSFLGATSAMEHQTKTLRLQVLTPLFVATKMINNPAASLLVISPEDYAREAVSTLGLHSYNGGCVAHELQFIAGLVLARQARLRPHQRLHHQAVAPGREEDGVTEEASCRQDIGALLNFVGTVAYGKLCENAAGVGPTVFNVNATSAVKLTDLILPAMAKADKGLIVHCSSSAGYRPYHNTSTYSASKAAMSFLSETTAMEYNSKTLRIQCLCPLYVSTKMTNFATPSPLVLSADEYASSAVSIVGLDSYATGSLKHEAQLMALALCPPWLLKYAYNFLGAKLSQDWGIKTGHKLD